MLDEGLDTEDGLDRFSQALGAIDDHKEALLIAQPPLDQLSEEGSRYRLVLRGGLDEPQDDLLPGEVIPSAMRIASSAKVLPSSSRATNS